MTAPHRSPAIGSLALIAIFVIAVAGAFAYTAGWLSPQRLTPGKLVDAFAPPSGVALGHRRNHAKGICFTGVFEANGAGSALSQASVFAADSTRCSGASTWEPRIWPRRMRPSGCVAWDYGSRRPTAKNGAV